MNDLTTQTSKTCTIEQSTVTGKQTECYFAVQTLICGNLAGTLSERVDLTLKGIVYSESVRGCIMHV